MTAANELSVLGNFYLSDEMNTYANQVLGQYLAEFLNSVDDWNSAFAYKRVYQARLGIHYLFFALSDVCLLPCLK